MNCTELSDGTITAECENPAVPQSLLLEIWRWMNQGASFEDAVERLRPRTVPPGYSFHTWKSGMFVQCVEEMP